MIDHQLNDLFAPRRSGPHLDGMDYDNTLPVLAAPNRRHEQRLERTRHVWEEVGMTDGLFEKR